MRLFIVLLLYSHININESSMCLEVVTVHFYIFLTKILLKKLFTFLLNKSFFDTLLTNLFTFLLNQPINC